MNIVDTPQEDNKPQSKHNLEDYTRALGEKQKELEELNEDMKYNKKNTNQKIKKLKDKILE